MSEQNVQKPLLSGLVYGEFAYWIALAGLLIALVGIVMYLFGANQFFDPNIIMQGLFEGKDASTIWKEATGGEVIYGHWYLEKLASSDGIAMLGIGVCCFAGVVGAWGAVVSMIVNKEKPYIFLYFALIIAVILILSAVGVISVGH